MKNITPIIFILLMLSSSFAAASCRLTAISQTEDGRTAIIPFGKVNLNDTYLQPVGTLLASVVVPPTNYTYGGANASSVLWECDKSDLDSIYFLVATNGDDRVGGFYDIGNKDGMKDVYATWFAYTGLKLTMSGVTLTRYWNKVPITSYATTDNGKIQIRLQDIPPLLAELYRVSSIPENSAASNYCAGRGTGGLGYATATGINYSCTQPNAYIQLSGDSNVSFSFARDRTGQDSAYSFLFWGADNGFGYGMRTANSLYQNPTCVARNVTPVVLFPTMSVTQLEEGATTSANFTVQVECNNSAVSGVNNYQTAIGFQVSPGAYNAAQQLGLVNANGGVSYLVSDNYFSNEMAHGVGIKIKNSLNKEMLFVGQPGTVSLTTPGGNNAGWYPVLDGATYSNSNASGYSTYNQTMTATLGKLPGQTVTAGKIYATSYVLVKMQ